MQSIQELNQLFLSFLQEETVPEQKVLTHTSLVGHTLLFMIGYEQIPETITYYSHEYNNPHIIFHIVYQKLQAIMEGFSSIINSFEGFYTFNKLFKYCSIYWSI